MKILYLTIPDQEDYLADSIFYGLRNTKDVEVVEYPEKDMMYAGKTSGELYGNGFTLWGKLPEVKRPDEDLLDLMFKNYFDVVIFSDIYRQQNILAHFTVYGYFQKTKAKFVFLDGSDDGFPCVYDAVSRGVYFKRDNPIGYPEVKIIGLSIPAATCIPKPEKKKLFTRYVQVTEAYAVSQIASNCTTERVFTNEADYYADLAGSKYGITMKKSGWDVPRHMENASHWVVNCIYTRGWNWNSERWYDRPSNTHPLGLEDMKNCILWDDPEMLMEKIQNVEKEGQYEKLSQGSYDWVQTKTCESMVRYMLNNI